MRFELLPLIDTMIAFYRTPRGSNRFNEYLQLLTGGTQKEMKMPIPHFNPMAKEHVLDQLLNLKAVDIEGLISDIIKTISIVPNTHTDRVKKISITLADDQYGQWTNKHTTDYAHRFDMDGFHNRDFCPVLLFSSESYTVDILSRIVEETCYRFLLWNGIPSTLGDHITQEAMVYKRCHNLHYLTELSDRDSA